MSFEIIQINNGWLLRFNSETGYHQFFFEDFEDATKIMKDVIKTIKAPIDWRQKLKVSE